MRGKLFRNLIRRLRVKLGFSTPDLEKLQRLGLRIGRDTQIQPGVTIDQSHCWLIEIGDRVTIAPGAIVMAHDASLVRKLGYAKIAQIIIESDAFIGAGAILLPGARIGSGAIIGAGAVVTGRIPADMVAVGVPARVVGSVADLIEKAEAKMADVPRFGREYTLSGGISVEMKREMVEKIGDRIGFVR